MDHASLQGQCGELEIPARFAARPTQEFQIHKPHWNHKVASAPEFPKFARQVAAK
jgi:hypothetical protein